jgi:trehalose synthase
MSLLDDYAAVAGADVTAHLQQLAGSLAGKRVVHVNSTRLGGGVAEILAKLVPLSRALGIDASWEVVEAEPAFFACSKAMHNGLQGNRVLLSEAALRVYEATNARNAERLREVLESADFVFVHDPQPAGLLSHFPKRRGKWIWRCHIDASHSDRHVWRYLRSFVAPYDASVFSLAAFAKELPHPQYVVPPSIDPLSDKNVDLPAREVDAVRAQFGLDPERPLIVQISRFDRFKDPLGVIAAHRLVKRFLPSVQLVLAGGGANDDPEGETVLEEVRSAAESDADAHVLLLPPDANRTVNALQRAADVVLQKSIREGFGLTVTEALWKGKPVVGGNVGGIRLQVISHYTGFPVDTPEGAALRVRYLLHHPHERERIGATARGFVRENFLITRHLREYLTLMVALLYDAKDRVALG